MAIGSLRLFGVLFKDYSQGVRCQQKPFNAAYYKLSYPYILAWYFSFSIAYCFTLPVVLYSYLDLCKGHAWTLSSSNALANFKSNTDMPLIQIGIMTSRRSNSSAVDNALAFRIELLARHCFLI